MKKFYLCIKIEVIYMGERSMIKDKFKIQGIPTVLWGEASDRVFIAVHGNMSNKEDTVIQMLAEEVIKNGYEVLSFDLPEHGDRKNEDTPCKVEVCIKELGEIMNYAKQHWKEINLFACSIGAYFSILAYKNEQLEKAFFLSPVVNMKIIIENMMNCFSITPKLLKKKKTIEIPIGQKLYWDYFCYVKEHPINSWGILTSIICGAKDELCEIKVVEAFAKRNCCELEIIAEGEHYFHTEQQLEKFKNWLEKHIK